MMTSDKPSSPAHADSPDADRLGTDAPARLPEWVVHLLALLIRFLLERAVAARGGRGALASWRFDRPDLLPGSAQAEAAAIRGAFGNAIAWMCRRRGIGPGHRDWPELSRAIVAFGGSLHQFRPGQPACGLQWFENPHLVPGMIGEIVATPAADALASLLSQQAAADLSAPATGAGSATARHARPARLPMSRLSARRPAPMWRHSRSTGPPTGPPYYQAVHFLTFDARGRTTVGPAVLIRAA